MLSLEEHPARRLYAAGVGISIGSDDPELFGITLSGELEVARRVLGWSGEEMRRSQEVGLAAMFR